MNRPYIYLIVLEFKTTPLYKNNTSESPNSIYLPKILLLIYLKSIKVISL